MNDDKFIKFLKQAKEHYSNLSGFMLNIDKEKYCYEHKGKVKFIDFILYLIDKGYFNENN